MKNWFLGWRMVYVWNINVVCRIENMCYGYFLSKKDLNRGSKRKLEMERCTYLRLKQKIKQRFVKENPRKWPKNVCILNKTRVWMNEFYIQRKEKVEKVDEWRNKWEKTENQGNKFQDKFPSGFSSPFTYLIEELVSFPSSCFLFLRKN